MFCVCILRFLQEFLKLSSTPGCVHPRGFGDLTNNRIYIGSISNLYVLQCRTSKKAILQFLIVKNGCVAPRYRKSSIKPPGGLIYFQRGV